VSDLPDLLAPGRAAPAALSAAPPDRCAACGAAGGRRLVTLRGVATNSCLMLPTPAAARGWPRGDIDLFVCDACGFIANRAIDPKLTEYSERYEPTQGWSPAFRRYHRMLAERIARCVPLAGRRVVEVGCGQGEFLHLLCRIAGATGLGFDPCVDPRRADVVQDRAPGVELVADFLDEESGRGLRADLLVCKMTLEHIPAVDRFAALCARVARQSAPGMRVFIQVPDSLRILREAAFEDIYYEHCNYFTEVSLRGLFARHGFVAEAIHRDYDDQYISLVARFTGASLPPEDPSEVAAVTALAAGFGAAHAAQLAAWRATLRGAGRVVVWGSGSKGVTFLGAMGAEAAGVTHVVDINPHRQGMFMVGSAHPIVGPEALRDIRPDSVVLMNRVYAEEVGAMLAGFGLSPRLLSL
jgi:SAM-dependent methyltransferase